MLERMIRHPIALVLGGLLIAVGGLASLRVLPVDLFPDLNYPLVNVITHYPAGTARDTEQLITRPIENAMLGLNNLRRVRSVSAAGFSQVTVEFTWGVDAMAARQMVYARLAGVQGTLPSGARPELENIGTSLAMLSTYTLRGDTNVTIPQTVSLHRVPQMRGGGHEVVLPVPRVSANKADVVPCEGLDPVSLRSWAQYRLAPMLSALPGVARVYVMGGGEAAYRVDLDPLRLRRYHLAAEDIARAVRAENVLDTGGYLERHGRDLLIHTEGRILDIKTLKGIVVTRGPAGRPVTLKDVARVYAGARPMRYEITSNRKPAVAFTIQKQPGASTLAVSRAVDQALRDMKLPPGVRLQKFYDQAEIIGLAYRNMRNNLLVGTLLAILALVWVMGWNRSTLILAVTFPLAVLGTFCLMNAAGMGINLMTLGALTVAIGMIADDAIVVLENIDRHRRQGKAVLAATLDGTREIVAADVAGTLTVLAAFVPLVLVSGLAGRLFQPFGLAFGFMLFLSLVLSLSLIPVAAARWLPPGAAPAHATQGARWIAWVGRWNHALLGLFMRHRVATLTLTVLALLSSLALMALNPARFLPMLDEDSLLLSYQLAPGTSLGESSRVGDMLEQKILAMPGVKGVFRRTGSPESSFYVEGPDQGELVIRLERGGGTSAAALKQRIERYLATLPGMVTRVNEPTTEKLDESFSGLPALFGITIYGTDLATLYRAAVRVEDAARRVPGLANVVNNTKVPVDQLMVRIDREKAARLGVRAREVARTVRLAMQGEDVTDILVNQRPVGIFLRYAESARKDPEDLGMIPVRARDGRLVPLSQLAGITPMETYPTIEHQRGLRALTLTAEIDGNPFSVMKRLDAAIRALGLPQDIHVGYTGEYHQLVKTGGQVLWVLLASAMLVYGIIALKLGNWLDPMVVLCKLPMDIMGAALALFLARQTLDVTVLIGFITLVGVSTNNGIMLLTFIQDFRKKGMALEEAVKEAVSVRTRPMLLTHMTTLLALVPAAFGFGRGPQLLQPLGVMLFGGLTAGTLLTLNVLPVIYVVAERWRRREKKWGSNLYS